MKKKQAWLVLFSCIVLALIGGLLTFLQPHYGLLDRAERIASVPSWTGQVYINGSSPVYEWLNAQDVLFYRREPGRSDLQGYRQKLLPVGQTGPPQRLTGITCMPTDPAVKHFSARGNWIHRSRYDGKANTQLEELVSLKDGSVRRVDYMDRGIWSRDGASIVNLFSGTVLAYQADTGATTRTVLTGFKVMPRTPAPPLSSFIPARTVPGTFTKPPARQHQPPDTMALLFGQPEQRLIAVRRGFAFFPNDVKKRLYIAPYENTTEYELYEFDLAHPDRGPRTWKIPTPKDATYGRINASPDGERLLWVVSLDLTTGLDRLLHRLFPKLCPAERHAASYRISKLDGSGMREIGRVDMPHWYLLGAPVLKWMPDGKHLSLVHNGVMYRIPAGTN
jgi:hypothetical protein